MQAREEVERKWLVSGGLQGAPVVRISGFSSVFSHPAALSVLLVVFLS